MPEIPGIPRNVLVTGASTGIGKACALNLARNGFSVLAGVRKQEDATNLEMIAGTNLRGVILDIADSSSIAEATGKIAEITSNDGLAGLVNNAGIGVHGPVEFLTRDDWRRQFEVNLFGHMELTAKLLESLRKHNSAAGAGSARIVFIGSIAGRISMPILSPYCASKHALAGAAGSLRLELRRQSIHVCLIEPGAIQSEIWRKGIEAAKEASPDAPARKLYGREIDAINASAEQSAADAIPAQRMATLVQHCLTSRNPPRRRTVGRDAGLVALLRRVLPEAAMDGILTRALKLK